jgi:diguanylate cyclase (GGDEF)-like protein
VQRDNLLGPMSEATWSLRRPPPGQSVPAVASMGAITLLSVVIAATTHSPIAVMGACTLLALLAITVRSAGSTGPLSGQALPLALGTGFLVLSDAGLGASGADQTVWRPMFALVAYPFLGRALLRIAGRYRTLREGDVVVEAVLVGAAAGIVLQVVVDWRGDEVVSNLLEARGALPAILVGLDVSLLAVVAHVLGIREARKGPLGLLAVGVIGLLATHLAETIRITTGEQIEHVGMLSAAIGLAAIGGAALHPRSWSDPDLVLEEPRGFSSMHAGVVVVALLAAPAVLAMQALRNITASTTMTIGTVVSGAILASYLLSLLRERAATEHRATHDGLTGLPNRALFTDRLDRAIAHARRNDLPVGVLFIDLDRFKEVNDSFGHAAGDQLLVMVAERLRACARDEDTVARLGGDEFAVLLPHLRSKADVVIVTQRILDALCEPVTLVGQRMLTGASVGVAVFPEDGATAAEVVASADAAMYRAKEREGSCFEIFNPTLATDAHDQLRLELALYDGMHRDELVLHYQPIVDLATGRTAGAEALVRWEHPEHGLLMPGRFVPLAERSDLVVLLSEQVIASACDQLARWQQSGHPDLFVAVNVSSRHFGFDLVSAVTAALRSSGADPRGLMIELTESTAVDNLDEVAVALKELRALGVRSAIDDFGTGYCGLRYLGTLPVDSLKIDQSFVQGMTPSDAAIIGATIAMGHSLGLSLTAEGVETLEQRRFLAAQGCDRIQGYHEAKPMPATELSARLTDEAAARVQSRSVARSVDIDERRDPTRRVEPSPTGSRLALPLTLLSPHR